MKLTSAQRRVLEALTWAQDGRMSSSAMAGTMWSVALRSVLALQRRGLVRLGHVHYHFGSAEDTWVAITPGGTAALEGGDGR